MKDHSFSGKHSISVITFLTKFKRACKLLYIHEGAMLWLFRDFMTGPALAAI